MPVEQWGGEGAVLPKTAATEMPPPPLVRKFAWNDNKIFIPTTTALMTRCIQRSSDADEIRLVVAQ